MGMNTDAVQRLYVAYFNRPADPTGLAQYEAMLSSTEVATQAELQAIAETYFSPSAEYTTNFDGLSNEAIVNKLYQNLFGRDAEPKGLLEWSLALADGSETVASIALQLSYSAQGTDADVIANKIEAAGAFTTALDTTDEIVGYSGDAAAASAASWLATVGSSEESKDTAIAGVDAAVAAAVAAGSGSSSEGQTLSLTTGVDTISGTSANDIVTGTAGGTAPTVTAGDSISGGAGDDMFAITATGAAAVTVAGVSLTDVETVRVSDTTTGANVTTVNLAGQSGVTTLESFGSAQANNLNFSNVGAIADLSLSNTSGSGTQTVTYSAAAVAGSNTQNVTLTSATSTGVTTIAGVETVAVTASGNSSIDLVASSAGTVTVNASDATTATLSNAANVSLTSVTGSGTGDITFVVDYSLAETTVTGGAGNDTIDISAAALGVTDAVDGGDGDDKLLFQSTTDVTSVASSLATVSNVEVLELEADDDGVAGTSADFAIDLDTVEGVTSVILDANDTDDTTVNQFTLNDINAVQLGAISAQVGAAGATVVLDAKDGTGTSDAAVISASLGSTAGTLTVTDSNNNIESLTITATGDNNQTIAITNGDFTGSTSADATLTISGGGAGRVMTISGNLSSDTVDLSGVLSGARVTLATGVDHTFTGGAGDDVITMTTGFTSADTIDGGDGTDVLSLTQTNTVTSATAIAGVETLRLGGTGTASLNLVGTTDLTTIDLEVTSTNAGTNTIRGYTGINTITIDADDNTAAQNDYQALTIVNAYTGTADTMTVDINSDATNGMNGTEGLITANGIETLTVDLDGGAAVQFGGFTSNTLSGVVVTANSDFVTADTADLGTITGGTNNTIASYDSSGADIAVTVTVASLGSNASVVLGDGADVFSTTGSTGENITIDAGAGADNITGAAGADIINGGTGDDTIDGVGGGDELNGGAGNDSLTGDDAEADTLSGGAGNDTMDGDGGLDSLTGGAGSDVFVLEDNVDTEADDLITMTDFTAGLGGDVLRMDVSEIGGAVAANATQSLVNVLGAADNSIIIDSAGTGYANEAAFATAVEAANNTTVDYIGIYFDTTDNVVKVVVDGDSSDATAPVLLGQLTNYNTDALADVFLAALVTQNFDVI